MKKRTFGERLAKEIYEELENFSISDLYKFFFCGILSTVIMFNTTAFKYFNSLFEMLVIASLTLLLVFVIYYILKTIKSGIIYLATFIIGVCGVMGLETLLSYTCYLVLIYCFISIGVQIGLLLRRKKNG